MDVLTRKNHWEKIYAEKSLSEVSWYQPIPEPSLGWISELNIAKDSTIIDVGGGDSFLVDFLLEKGFTQLSVLDISSGALQRAKHRIGVRSDEVCWIESDVLAFNPSEGYKLWHDRAAFHFLTDPQEVHRYVQLATKAILPGGYLLIATFSKKGPLRCSGIDITQYDERELSLLFEMDFELVRSSYIDHTTPFGTMQNFLFCTFRKKIAA